MTPLELVEAEARAAKEALAALSDDLVGEALGRAVRLLDERRADVLRANADDVRGSRRAARRRRARPAAARRRRGSRRSRTGSARPRRCRRSSARSRSWQLADGTRVSERRIPVGVVGANFEARPNVAVDVASQVLKSGNAVVLRTGGAALGTVRVLVDEVLRPALDESGLPGEAVGLVRSPERSGAEALVSLPGLIPLVILRGSGESTAALERLAASNGVRTLAHAEGGGVLYVHGSAARGDAGRRRARRASTGSACATGSTSRSSTARQRRSCRRCSRRVASAVSRCAGPTVPPASTGCSRSTGRAATSGPASRSGWRR